MPTQIRQKHSGALIFHQTKDENQAVKDRRKMKEMEKKLKEMEKIISDLKEK
jgi:hypothetical protein